MAPTTFAHLLVRSLRDLGVQHIYGLVGDSLNPIVDAVRTTDGIDWVHVRNEEAAAFAAGAEARLTGRLAVCAASCGPGNTHLIQGLFDAHRDGAPVLAIASHIPSVRIGSGYFQETHPEILFRECSHYCELVNSPAQGLTVLHSAIQTAIARRGVSVVVLPGDVSDGEVDPEAFSGTFTCELGRVQPPADQVRRAAELLNSARKVAIFAGAGVQGAHDEVIRLAEALKSPIGHAFGGKEWIEWDNPFNVGMSGLLGYGACYEAMEEADLVLLLGTDFPYTEFLPGKRTIQIDADATRLGRRATLELGLHGDTALTIEALLPLLETKRDNRFLEAMLKKHEKALSSVVAAYTKKVDRMVPIHPEYLAAQLDEVAADDAVFTVDTGMCNVWNARYITPNGRRRIMGSWHHGTMANALPQAIGAAVSHPDRQVVSMSGDGGLGMLLGELLTVKLHRLDNLRIVLFNNSSLGMVRAEMLVEGMPAYETDHEPVDFAAIAAAVGLNAVRITDPKRLPEQLREAFAQPGPMLIDVVTDPEALAIPPKITWDQIRGFATASSRMVLAGGVGAMAQLAKSNLRNIPH